MTEKHYEPVSIAGETLLVAWAALAVAVVSLAYCFRHDLLLLFGDSVAHLYIARRIFDSRNPGFRQLGSVWLPLPHILLLPFVLKTAWWRNGLAGAWVSIPSYVLGCAGLYRLARTWLSIPIAIVAVAFYAFNPGLLYMATTAMTEPLFLAEMIWAVLLIVQYQRTLDGQPVVDVPCAPGPDPSPKLASPAPAKPQASPQRLLVAAGFVLVCAIFTRYDGWILAAAAWVFVTLRLALRRRAKKPLERPVLGAWLIFTILLAAAPAAWLVYNAKLFGDPLDFMRGPYSAQAIESRTSAPGAPRHPGYHSMRVSALYFLKAAEMGAVPLRFGNTLFWLSIAGTLAALFRFRRRKIWPVLLFWLPLPFYAYAVAYGSVPIFIPIWPPHSWYNTRYGMELLPAFALFGACCVAALLSLAFKWTNWLKRERWPAAVLVLLIVLNSAILLRAKPLVFQEAVANSRTRIAFERALANSLLSLPPRALILMNTSKAVGAIQRLGILLRRTVNEGDYAEWRRALEEPAQSAAVVVALDGDPVAEAVQRRPGGLDLLEVVCSTGQPCARIYRSRVYAPR